MLAGACTKGSINAFEITFGNITVEIKEGNVSQLPCMLAGAYTKSSINAFYITFGNITVERKEENVCPVAMHACWSVYKRLH